MKVLQINSVCGVGSTGRIAADIHALLEEQGQESWIAYGRGEAKNCENTIKIGTDFDNYIHVAKTRLLDQHGFGSKKATNVFIEKMKKLNPDVIHLHNIHGYYLNIEVLFKYLRVANKPIIWTFHDCWPFTGHCSYFDFVGCTKWETGCYNCPQKKNYPSSFLRDNSKENYISKKELFTGIENLTIVTPSKWLANLVRQSFLGEYPIEVINNGIDLGIFKPTKSNFREKYDISNCFLILGVAGDWEPRKGLKYFIEIADKLADNEVIVLVGLTNEQIKNLPSNIIGITKTSNTRELVEIYSTANVFVNPTLEDNFPTTNLEAMACGTPVITFNTGGSIESIKDKDMIVEKGDLENLFKTIKTLKTRKVNSEDCREHSKKYNKNIKFDEYINLYSILLK